MVRIVRLGQQNTQENVSVSISIYAAILDESMQFGMLLKYVKCIGHKILQLRIFRRISQYLPHHQNEEFNFSYSVPVSLFCFSLIYK